MKIGLALSGGGAIGAAHAGILDALEQEKIKIDCIAGTSAGAIVGLLYAQGGIPLIDQFMSDLEEAGLFHRSTIIFKKNEKIFSTIEEILRKNVTAKHFNDLNIKFRCIATDILTGEAVEISQGDPVSAVMASAAYPGVFPAQKIYDHLCVDGALTKNLPASVAQEMGAGFVIGSSLYAISQLSELTEENKSKIGLLTVAVRSVDIMSKILSEYEMEYCDFCFMPPVETYNWYNFHKIREIRQLGREHAQAEMKALKRALTVYKHSQKKGLLDIFISKLH